VQSAWVFGPKKGRLSLDLGRIGWLSNLYVYEPDHLGAATATYDPGVLIAPGMALWAGPWN
jgi:hypothetical protein